MSTLKEPKPVKLVFSVIYNQSADTDNLKHKLRSLFGEIDYESKQLDFVHSEYYRREMGDKLQRKFFSAKNLIKRENIVTIKHTANDIEKEHMQDDKRTVNIDPGYLAQEHLILATGKGFAHRPYLGNGVYADLTLIYTQNNFQSLDWTYPDYNENNVKEIFKHLRNLYISNLSEVDNHD